MTAENDRATIVHAIGVVRATYEPRITPWTGKTPDEQAEMSATWLESLERFRPHQVLAAVRRWGESPSGQHCPSLNDLLLHCQAEARHEAASEAEFARQQATFAAVDNSVPPAVGIRIAWHSYTAECGRRGVVPNRDRFAQWLPASTL